MRDLSSWAEHINEPVVLVGFVMMLFIGIIHILLKKNVLALSDSSSERLIGKSLLYGFVLSLAVIVLGFALAHKQSIRNDRQEEIVIRESERNQSSNVVSDGKGSRSNMAYSSSSREKDEQPENTGSDKKEEDTASQSPGHITQKTHGNPKPCSCFGR